MKSCMVLKEDVEKDSISGSDLTTDCYYVHRQDSKIDLARGSAVCIFDHYHDNSIKLTKIELAGGTLNPKNSSPRID